MKSIIDQIESSKKAADANAETKLEMEILQISRINIFLGLQLF